MSGTQTVKPHITTIEGANMPPSLLQPQNMTIGGSLYPRWMLAPGTTPSMGHITPSGQSSNRPWRLNMGQAMPAPCQDYEAMPLGPVRSVFGSLQASTMSPQLMIWKWSPELYCTYNDTLEPEIIDLEYDDVGDHMENNVFALLNSIKDSIWDASPLQNLRLRAKMHQVAHANMVEVLTLLGLPIDPDSERYHMLYAWLFHALVAKKIGWKTLDSHASTPSMTGVYNYLPPGETLMPRHTWGTMVIPVKEEATVPPTLIHQANITFTNPVMDNDNH